MEQIRKWCTAAILVFLPMQTHWLLRMAPWEFGTGRLLMVEGVILGLSCFFVHEWWRQRTVRARSASVVALVGTVVWGVGIGQGNLVAVLQSVHLLSAGALGIVLWESARRWGVHWVLSWYLVGGVGWAMMGIMQWVQQSVMPSTLLGVAAHDPSVAGDSVVLMNDVRKLRAYGPAPHPNIFGGWMVAYIYAAILLIRSGSLRTWWYRWMGVIALMLAGLALVLSFSRSAWIAGGIVVVGAIAWRRTWRTWLRIGVLPVAAVIAVAMLVAPGIAARLQRDNVLELRSQSERVGLLSDGVRLVKANLFVGTGLGLATTGMQQQDPSRAWWTLQPPHFTALLLVVELGIIGVGIAGYCAMALPWGSGLFVLIPGLIFDHFYWSVPAGLFLLTVLWFLSTIQAKLALDQ